MRRVTSHSAPLRRWTITCALLISLLGFWVLPAFTGATALAASAPDMSMPSDASCAQLAHADPSATNGPEWGATILPGLDQSGGWFGVPVCANSLNQFAPGGANVSCDRIPTDFAAHGCAPGAATSDGYGLSFQCVELVARFAAWAFGDAPYRWRGDAEYLWLTGHHPADFSAYANGGTHAPMPGDVLIWGSATNQGNPWPAGPAGGHTAVVWATSIAPGARVGHISFVEENMLGSHGNIPSETTTLTLSAGHWTIGPTYGTNGGRKLYGWLHSSRDTGQFGGSGASGAPVASAPTPTPAPTTIPPASTNDTSVVAPAPPQSLPSLAHGVIVTGAGALAELAWSDSHSPAAAPTRIAGTPLPHAAVESLGAPPHVGLAPDQTPAIVTLPTGERYVFVRGSDGRLYAAYTAPGQPGALWQALGAPKGVTLMGAVTALWDSDGMIVGALGGDGAFWLRAGPAGSLGDWATLGRPRGAALQGTPALVAAPATAASSGAVTRLALAVGRDGRLYSASWTNTAAGVNGALPPGWSAWTSAPLTGVSSPLRGGLLSLANQPATDAAMLDVMGDPTQSGQAGGDYLLATDTAGHVWVLRLSQLDQPWSASPLALPNASDTVLAATLTSSASDATAGQTLDVYVSEPLTSATPAVAPVSQSTQPAAGQSVVLGSIPLDAADGSAAVWRRLGASAATGAPVALGLGPGLSALLTAQGDAVALSGATAALQQLAPGAASASATASASGAATDAPGASLVIGAAPQPTMSSDTFAGSALGPRWLISGASPDAARVSQGTLTLTLPTAPTTSTASATSTASTAPDDVVALQGAPSGAFVVTAHVAPGSASAPSASGDAQMGLLLALDDWNSATLALRANDTVALCVTTNGAPQPCSVVALPAQSTASANLSQGAYLRLSQSGAELVGQVSKDGTHWTSVGAWNVSWLPDPSSIAGAYAPPSTSIVSPGAANAGVSDAGAWLCFSGVGLYIADAGAQSQPAQPSAQFSSFTVTTAGQAG